MTRLSIAVAATLSLMSSAQVSAESVDLNTFDCGAQQIKVGMETSQFKSGCTEQPSFVSQRDRPALKQKEGEKPRFDHFEKWMYQSVGQQATHVLIKNGKVIRIFTNSMQTARQ